ncbi:SRPBCC domain-containing protein [Streptomyces sp. NPDC057426]|uniref:SRPBCC domain-containing protein n=1 Tax=Streptomyces sp. NPDC057426 TaxID=3346128 RepID=UPI0036AFAB4C
MEHEVFVPVPAEVLRATLTDPARVARCVPGLQQDAEEGPLAGRLKIRAGGNTITYRGALRLTERGDVISVEGKGTEVRGKGSVKLSLAIALTPVADGTTLAFTGAVKVAGRLADLSEEAREAAAQRLIDKFVAGLAAATQPSGAENGRAVDGRAAKEPDDASGTAAGTAGAEASADEPGSEAVDEPASGRGSRPVDEPGSEPEPRHGRESEPGSGSEPRPVDEPADEPGSEAVDEPASGRGPEPEPGSGSGSGREAVARSVDDALDGIDDEADSDSDGVDDGVEEPHRPSVFETPVPPPSLGPFQGEDFEDAPVEYPAEPPAAEAAHARRTMIGRSAEEVDHAPPRGRYAPVPATESTTAGATLRWIAPAAALALASAVVVGRALRRRR